MTKKKRTKSLAESFSEKHNLYSVIYRFRKFSIQTTLCTDKKQKKQKHKGDSSRSVKEHSQPRILNYPVNHAIKPQFDAWLTQWHSSCPFSMPLRHFRRLPRGKVPVGGADAWSSGAARGTLEAVDNELPNCGPIQNAGHKVKRFLL